MEKYRKYSEDEISQASKINLVDFLIQKGEEIKKCGSEYVWSGYPEKVTIRGNVWFNHYTQKGGDAISFAREFYNASFPEAISILIGDSYSEIDRPNTVKISEKKDLYIPEKNETMSRVYGYLLNSRGISKDILNTFVQNNMIYEEKKYHNVVFIGRDKGDNIRHVHMRGSGLGNGFKMTTHGSEPEFSFHWNGTDNELFLFEAPIDMLSYISMNPDNWEAHSYAAACSVTDKVLFQCLKDFPQISMVHICFDNDEAGENASRRLVDKLIEYNVVTDRLVPNRKDWNEDLNMSIHNSFSMKL